jgi:SAM-dependent methyltransferase
MLNKIGAIINKINVKPFYDRNPVHNFHSNAYMRHNARRLEHLSSLRISVANRSVLEVGAGIGDHSGYFIDRGCKITITDARKENLRYLRDRYPGYEVQFLDMDNPTSVEGSPFDVVYCYGLLYHLAKPAEALSFLSQNSKGMLFLETCVSFGENEEINLIREPRTNPTQAYAGNGCRPTRVWIFKKLQELFQHVYLPITQPNHEEFPIDWDSPEKHTADLQRSIFIASREKINNEMLTTSLIKAQRRHE